MWLKHLRPAGRIRLAPAGPRDVPALGRILSDWIDETPWLPRVHSRDDERGFAASMVAHGWVTVAHRGGAVVGFLARDGEEVVALHVARAARGQGVGTALMARAKRHAPRLRLWTFEANHSARAFYAREGFAEVGRGDGADNDENLPDVRYLWERRR